MVKRGHEIDLEYSRNEIIDKMNTFFGYSVVEKLKLISFDDEKKFIPKISNQDKNVTNSKYQKKIASVRNEKIKNSLIELIKVFRKK